MKKLLSLLLVCILILSLSACGGGAPASSDASKAENSSGGDANSGDDSGTASKVSSDDYEFKFGDSAVLYESDQLLLSAKRMTGKNGFLTFFAHVENKTSETLRSRLYSQSDSDVDLGGSKSDPNSSGTFRMLEVSNWNGMIGETEECFLGTFQIEFTAGDERIDLVQFDLYASEKAPFANILTGSDVVPYEEEDPAAAQEEKDDDTAENADSEDSGIIKVSLYPGDTSTPEIFKIIEESLSSEGITFEFEEMNSDIVEYTVEEGYTDLCLGYGGREHSDALSPIAYTTVTPWNLYSVKYSSPEEIPDDESIGIFGGYVENSARIQVVLEAAGIIKTKNGPANGLPQGDVEYRVSDIRYATDYDAMLGNIENLGAVMVPGELDSMEPIFADPGVEDKANWNTILVRTEDLNDPAKREICKKIADAYHSDAVLEILRKEKYVPLPAGWDEDLI